MSVKTVSLPQAGITVKLGRKRPAVPPKTLKLRRYLLKDLPPPPSSADWATPVKSWPMYMNNKIGDCTAAAGGHEIGCFTANTASLRRLCDAGRDSQTDHPLRISLLSYLCDFCCELFCSAGGGGRIGSEFGDVEGESSAAKCDLVA